MTTHLSRLEQASGTVFGLDPDVAPLPRPARGVGARAVLEGLLADALAHPPCVVSFSGGRDSSAVLAVAARVARREGLPAPVPVTLRFPDVDSTHESQWQETVVRHLGLADWVRLEFTDELDLVGPVAADVLRRHGVQWPFNAYFHVPVLEQAPGGTVLTGVGGDELFSSGWAWQRENLVLSRRRRPLPMDPVRIAVALGPRRLRERFLSARFDAKADRRPVEAWLRPGAREMVHRALIEAAAHEPVWYDGAVRRGYWPRRAHAVGQRSLAVLASEHGATIRSPLADPAFVAAVAAERGRWVFDDRTAATRWLAGDVLPPELVGRDSKAFFDGAFFGRHSRAFAATWDGAGVDPELVDVDALRALWTDPARPPDARTYTLLQCAWVAQNT